MDDAKDEENNNEANASSWWGALPSWIQSAKEKSSTALEFMKRDLTEFSQVVQTDAVAAVSSTAAILKEKLTVDNAEAMADKARQSVYSVFESITDAFAPHKELQDSELMIIKDSEPVVMDWWQSQLYLIRKDPKTFCHEPEGPPEMYENWLEAFDPQEYQEEMTEIMMTCSDIRSIYDKLVPTSVSHLEFWQRYFYRVHLLRKAGAKRADLMRRAEQISIEDIEWDKDSEVDPESVLSSFKDETFQQIVSTPPPRSGLQDQKDILSKSNHIQSTTTIDASSPLKIIQTDNSPKKTVTSDKPKDDLDISTQNKTENNLTTNISVGDAAIVSDPPSTDSNDENRSSPIESLGKDSSTGDEWEKDFDLEINENDLKILNTSSKLDENKEDEDDWEKWQ
ncbi:hypothetical protein JTE90_006588 [Oedothorax gibbosus]|uniref:BSD domain-containing protein n=1 Tax=Oedothorax gibbosus TaxID=931172 RepID=A0AAV6VIX3_9ARAC|nr:hypothetical protein JTE90_006588 [Oedothorax gibbosus]